MRKGYQSNSNKKWWQRNLVHLKDRTGCTPRIVQLWVNNGIGVQDFQYGTSDAIVFSKLEETNRRQVTFEDRKRGKIIRVEKDGKNSRKLLENVYFVDGFEINLLSDIEEFLF